MNADEILIAIPYDMMELSEVRFWSSKKYSSTLHRTSSTGIFSGIYENGVRLILNCEAIRNWMLIGMK
jgi:hypothetical protein